MKSFVVPGDWRSWVPVAPESHFPIQNLPYGIFSKRDGRPARVGVAIGEFILDTGLLHDAGLLDGPDVFHADTLNPVMSLGRGAWTALRQRLAELLRDTEPVLRDDERLRARALVPVADATLHMP
ncbi:MAG: fumarylacetoacetase, partial [Fimbriimonadaceae bacterium]|nr:fumarylacetoacetase [Fimbriimonadaceae bacterium]